MDELLPVIKGEQLSAAAEQGMDEFISIFTNAYLEMIHGDLTSESMQILNGHQNTLIAYHYFTQEIQNGGFVQLIQNGYGAYIFDNPFAKAMRLFGAKELSKLIYKAKKIYDQHRTKLERESTEDEFMAMYEEFEVFDELEEEYFEIEEESTAAIAHYLDENLEWFATIKE